MNFVYEYIYSITAVDDNQLLLLYTQTVFFFL